jgi:hypothetical protein
MALDLPPRLQRFRITTKITALSDDGLILMNNNVLFLDMEFGAIYGSYYRDFIPIEIGGIIYNLKTDSLSFVNHKFLYDGDVVLRKNLTDDLGHTIGSSETVANIKRNEFQKKFDPSYSLSDKRNIRKKAYPVLGKLRYYFSDLVKRYHVKQLVLFGGNEDLKLFNKAHINISNLNILDIQYTIVQVLEYQFSLDKISRVIKFYSNKNFIGSTHFRYTFPHRYRHVIKPHRAIGDACRTFLVYKEFFRDSQAFIEKSIDHLYRIAKREAEKVEQVYAILSEVFPDVSSCGSEDACFIVEPAKKPYVQNGSERKHFPFVIKVRNFTISKKLLNDPSLIQERDIYPFKFHGTKGYYCGKIQDVKAIAARYNVEVYTSIN